MKQLIKKWISETTYVDIETGEVITKSLAEREYIVLRTTKKTKIYENIGKSTYTKECERNRQQRIEF